MTIKINTPKVKSWTDDLDENTMAQAQATAAMPFVRGHLALMPDAHLGKGSTIGSVIPTEGAIIPAAVGVDIGCGMIACQVNMTASQLPDNLGPLHSAIARAVPAGVGKGHETGELMKFPFPEHGDGAWTDKLKDKAMLQFGSLGSGNHFVEVCIAEDDTVWVVLHSGSRGVGNELAKYHIDGAKGLMKRFFIDLPDPDLAYLVEHTRQFDAYITDMQWAQEYAMGNRQRMLHLVLGAMRHELQWPILADQPINCHHNYTEREHHMGRNVWLTRKGAIRAREGDLGVIPGSMGAASYIVEGLGSKASYHSCSHGAGRRMSRSQARRELDLATLESAMAGKAWNDDAKNLIDEDPRAYKDIDVVMANQEDLVRVRHTLHQVLNYKGL